MSDSVTKWYEMQEERQAKIFESPDGGQTVTERPFGGDISEREVIKKPILSEGDKRDAYTILSIYSEESILEAARILNGR
jgi:hypothetical protein